MNKAVFCLVFLFAGFNVYAEHSSFTITVTDKGQPIMLIPGHSCRAGVWEVTDHQLKGRYESNVINIAEYGGAAIVDISYRQARISWLLNNLS